MVLLEVWCPTVVPTLFVILLPGVISCLAIGMNVVGRWALYGSTSSVAEAVNPRGTQCHSAHSSQVTFWQHSKNMAVNGNGTVDTERGMEFAKECNAKTTVKRSGY